MAAGESGQTGLSPSHAYLMILVKDKPGIGQKELCEQLRRNQNDRKQHGTGCRQLLEYWKIA